MRKLIAIVCLSAACSATKSTTEPVRTSTNAAPATAAQQQPEPAPQTAAQTAAQAGPAKSGEELYAQICVTCHGKTGDGKGLDQQLFAFDTPADQWKNGPTIEGIVTTLQDGVHNTSMAAFPKYGAAEREAIAAYVLELRAELMGE